MINILDIQPTVLSRDLKGKFILLYGNPKVGKTSLAASFPKSLLLAFEAGFNGLANAKVQPISKWTEFKTVIKQLNNQQAKEMYSTIIIDTADLAYDLCEKYICTQMPIKDPNTNLPTIAKNILDIPWGKGSDALKKEFDACIREIAMMGYGIVLISHAVEKKVFGAAEETKIRPTLNNAARLIVNRFVDIIVYLTRETDPKTKEEKRFMYTRDSDKYEAGTRFKYLAPKIELGYQNLVDALHKAIDKQTELEGVNTTDNFVNNYKEQEQKDIETLKEEAKALWETISNKDKNNCIKMKEIIEDVFGHSAKISDAIKGQEDLVEEVIKLWTKEFNL